MTSHLSSSDVREHLERFAPAFDEKSVANMSQAMENGTAYRVFKSTTDNQKQKLDYMFYAIADRGGPLRAELQGMVDALNPDRDTYTGKIRSVSFVFKEKTRKLNEFEGFLLVAGAFSSKEAFFTILQSSPYPDLAWSTSQKIGHSSFLQMQLVKYVIHRGASEAVQAQYPEYKSVETNCNLTDAAHYVVAAYLSGEDIEDSQFKEVINELAHAIAIDFPGVDPLPIWPKYRGTMTGILLAGVIQFSHNVHDAAKQRAKRFEIGFNVVASILSLIPKAGGLIGGLLTAFAPMMAKKISNREDQRPELIKIGAEFEDAVSRGEAEDDARIFSESMGKALRHCGFAY